MLLNLATLTLIFVRGIAGKIDGDYKKSHDKHKMVVTYNLIKSCNLPKFSTVNTP
jgi:hypothetical protein